MGELPALRASDADREVASEQLREHHRAGRLSTEELEERLGRALGARTVEELAALLLDLPSARPAAPAPPAPVARRRPGRTSRAVALGGLAVLALGAGSVVLGDEERGGFLEPEPSVSTVISGTGRDGDLAFRVVRASEVAGELVVAVRVENTGTTGAAPFCGGGAALRTDEGDVVEPGEAACARELGPGEAAEVDLTFVPDEGSSGGQLDLWDADEPSDPAGATRLRFPLRTG